MFATWLGWVIGNEENSRRYGRDRADGVAGETRRFRFRFFGFCSRIRNGT